jgi:hypothetical protein
MIKFSMQAWIDIDLTLLGYHIIRLVGYQLALSPKIYSRNAFVVCRARMSMKKTCLVDQKNAKDASYVDVFVVPP